MSGDAKASAQRDPAEVARELLALAATSSNPLPLVEAARALLAQAPQRAQGLRGAGGGA